MDGDQVLPSDTRLNTKNCECRGGIIIMSTDVTFPGKNLTTLAISDSVLCKFGKKASKECRLSPGNQEWPLNGLLILPPMRPMASGLSINSSTFPGPLASAEVDVLFRSGSQIVCMMPLDRHGISQ